MKLQLVTKQQAELLKELGFDWHCDYFYDHSEWEFKAFGYCHNKEFINEDKWAAPYTSLVIKWFRDVHKIHVEIGPMWLVRIDYLEKLKKDWSRHLGYINFYEHYHVVNSETKEEFDTYEEAELAAIDYVLNKLNNENT